MTMIVTVKRNHEQIETIIRNAIERKGGRMEQLNLYGIRAQNKLTLCCEVELVTRQNDVTNLSLQHDQIMELIEDSLYRNGYEKFAANHVIDGHDTVDDCQGNGLVTDITMLFYYDIASS